MTVHFRHLLLVAVLLGFAGLLHAAEEVKRVAVLDAVIIHGSERMPISPEEQQRLNDYTSALRAALDASDRYVLVDHGELDALIEQHVAGQRLENCRRCQARIGRELGADQVFMPRVFKVSELILSMELEIMDTESGEGLARDTVRIAGNTDESWRRGALSLSRSRGLVE